MLRTAIVPQILPAYASYSLYAFELNLRASSVIGFVGATGLATGPHLHYEFRINDVHQNPLRVAMPAALPISPEMRPKFEQTAQRYTERLDLLRTTNLARLD